MPPKIFEPQPSLLGEQKTIVEVFNEGTSLGGDEQIGLMPLDWRMVEAAKGFMHLGRCLMMVPNTPNFSGLLRQCLGIQADTGCSEASYYLQKTVDGLRKEIDNLHHSLDEERTAYLHAEYLL